MQKMRKRSFGWIMNGKRMSDLQIVFDWAVWTVIIDFWPYISNTKIYVGLNRFELGSNQN